MISRSLGNSGRPEVFYRVITPAFARVPRSGAGAARQGGRFNRPGQEALYLALDEFTALAEYKQDNPWLPPGTICTFFLNETRVADLSAGFDPGQWDPLWSDFACDWRAVRFGQSSEPATWLMADDVLDAGLDGILFPSQARVGGTNLAIFDSSTKTLEQLDVYAPQGSLKNL